MKGDPRLRVQCPFCDHITRPWKKLIENGYIPTTTAEQIVRDSMKLHFRRAHQHLPKRKFNAGLRVVADSVKTMQMQLMDPTQGATARLRCPVQECVAELHTWADPDTGKLVYGARHAVRQHLNHVHPDLSLREKSMLLEDSEFRIIIENGAGPGRPPEGPRPGGPALLNLVATPRPDGQAHASGKVKKSSSSRLNKSSEIVIVQTSTA